MFYANLEHFKGTAGYEIDGDWYPRVTKIVEIKAKPALYKFYAEMNNFSEGEAVKKQSAGEGTLIHQTIEKFFQGKLSENDIPANIKPAIKSFLKFQEEKKIIVDPEYVEKRIVNLKEKYAGTLDALALIDGKIGVMDIKTSQSIYKDYNLQTAAYMAALEDKINLQTRWILRIDQVRKCLKCGAVLREKGGRKKIRNESNNCSHQWSELIGDIELKEFPYWQKDYQAFLGAKKLWEWENEYWLKQIGYL